MERTCPSCGADPGAGTFCQHCGTRLSGESAPEPSSDQPASPPPPTPPQTTPQQAPQKRSGFRGGCLVVSIIVLAALAAGAFFAWRFINDEVLPEVQEATDQFSALSESPPGPCFDLEVENGILTGWDEVPCDGPREVEVSFAASFEEGSWPGDEYLADSAADTCLTAFENYVGVSPDQSAYDFDWLVPTETQWAEGVRNGICLVVADDGSTLTGTVKGSER